MISIYYLLFFLISGLITYSYFERKYWEFTYFVIGFILILFAAFRGDVDPDYLSYVEKYSRIGAFKGFQYIDSDKFVSVEPTFYFLSLIVKTIFNHSFFLFLIYAVIGVTAKLIAIRRLSQKYYLLPLLFYSMHFFFLHEMTQIRAGVACGIAFSSLVYVNDKKPIKFILMVILAALFHYSALMFLPFYFLNDRINVRIWVAVFIFASLMAFIPFSFLSILEKLPGLGVLSSKISIYQGLADSGFINKINLFNAHILLNQSIILLLLIVGIERIESIPFIPILLKINIIALLGFMCFKALPVLSFRIYEFLAFSQIFLFSCLMLLFKEKKWVYVSLIAIVFLYLVIDVNIVKLLSEYTLNPFRNEY